MGRNRLHDQQIKDIRREQILSCALTLFASNGLAATKITDIAAAAGISHGLMYTYFNSKEELYTELIGSAFEKLNAACLELERLDMQPREKIVMAMNRLLAGIAEHEDNARYHVLIAQAGISDATPAEAKTILLEARDLPYRVMARIIREGQADGSVKEHDADDLAVAFWTTVKGIAFHRAIWGDQFRLPDPNILIAMFVTDNQPS